MALLRQLHASSRWTRLVNEHLLASVGNGCVASLAVLGGVTGKPRIGADVLTPDAVPGSSLAALPPPPKKRDPN